MSLYYIIMFYNIFLTYYPKKYINIVAPCTSSIYTHIILILYIIIDILIYIMLVSNNMTCIIYNIIIIIYNRIVFYINRCTDLWFLDVYTSTSFIRSKVIILYYYDVILFYKLSFLFSLAFAPFTTCYHIIIVLWRCCIAVVETVQWTETW
jgi:hypothetical protein